MCGRYTDRETVFWECSDLSGETVILASKEGRQARKALLMFVEVVFVPLVQITKLGGVMGKADYYVDLLDEYVGAYELVVGLDHTLQASPLFATAGIAMHSRLVELREYIGQAIRSSPESDEQLSAESGALKAAQDFDDTLRSILREQHMSGEWERHEQNVQSIVGRWPRVPPKRSRYEGQ